MYFGVMRAVERNWGWVLTLGILQTLLGAVALTFVGLTTFLSVTYLGFFFILEGLFEIYVGIQNRKQGHLGAHLFFGVLYVVGGVLIVANPIANAVLLTTLIALLLLVSGCVGAAGALIERGSNWGWALAMGLVSVFLGISVLQTPLASSVWLIGTFVGVEMMLKGFTLINLAWAGRKLNGRTAPAAAAHA